ncbi:17972_t:CDS:2 [Rhizophagus irregularis]|nr:17972_t:CDS:2 [Rhizophagus irregularis]
MGQRNKTCYFTYTTSFQPDNKHHKIPQYKCGSLVDELRNFKQGSKESVESYGNRVYDLIEM